MLPNLRDLPYFVLDVETTGLKYPVDKVFGFSICLPDEQVFYWDVRLAPNVVQWLQDEVSGYKGRIVCHHAKFDWLMCRASGISIPEDQLLCTMTQAVLIDEHLYEYNLDSLGHIYDLGRKVVLPSKANMADVPFFQMEGYAKQDALLTHKLYKWQTEEINRQGIHSIVDFEHRVLPRICRANAKGIRVDLELAEQAMNKLTPIILEETTNLNELCGWTVNVNSGPQIKKIFDPQMIDGSWRTTEGVVLEKTDNGNPSIGAEALRRMKHPAAAHILNIRSMLKTRDTFLAKHIIEHAVGDRVYPTINQNKGEDGGTGTGRLSYVDPAMQQIPSRNKKVAAIVKPCFLPDFGHMWVDTDEASFEVRVFAHLVNNPKIIDAYKQDQELDFHQFVADLTGLVRNATYSGQPNAKQLNLSMIFNSGNGAIAEEMGMPWTWDAFLTKDTNQLIRYQKAGPEAMAVINHYHETIPGIKKLAQQSKQEAEDLGYVETFTGRRLRFPNKRYAYKASGLKIQATAADINKLNWILIEEALDGVGRLVLNTHDSYGMSIPEDMAIKQAHKVKNHLEDKNVMNIPVILEVNEPGGNWWVSTSGRRVL